MITARGVRGDALIEGTMTGETTGEGVTRAGAADTLLLAGVGPTVVVIRLARITVVPPLVTMVGMEAPPREVEEVEGTAEVPVGEEGRGTIPTLRRTLPPDMTAVRILEGGLRLWLLSGPGPESGGEEGVSRWQAQGLLLGTTEVDRTLGPSPHGGYFYRTVDLGPCPLSTVAREATYGTIRNPYCRRSCSLCILCYSRDEPPYRYGDRGGRSPDRRLPPPSGGGPAPYDRDFDR